MILKFTLRSIAKRPLLNFIRVLGLSLSLSGVLLIVLFLENELTFESFNKNADRIYRLTISSTSAERQFARVLNTGFVPLMAGTFPEVENYVRLAPVNGGLIRYDDEYFSLEEGFLCDSTFLELFGGRPLTGNPEGILDAPGSMILSESFSKRIFGNSDPTGKVLTVPKGQYYGTNTDFTVMGVMKDFPQNSHFHPEFIATPADRSVFDGWAWVYLLLSKEATPEKITDGFSDFIAKISGIDPAEIKIKAELQKITAIHLRSDKLREIEENSSMSVIRTLATASLILLIIALANYANLNIGMAGFCEKYLFVAQVSGSSGLNRIKFFLTEGTVILTVSVIIGLFISSGANAFILKHFSLDLFAGNAPMIITVVIIFGLLVLLADIIPVMKWRVRTMTITDSRKKEILNRKGLSRMMLVLQYAVSTALIIAVFVIIRQTNFALNSTMAGRSNNLICFRNVHSEINRNLPYSSRNF
jgi:putative ABC transport system permease protein